MNEVIPSCCICAETAIWFRTRMPNEQQMGALCQRHHTMLEHRNPLLASFYDLDDATGSTEHVGRSGHTADHYLSHRVLNNRA